MTPLIALVDMDQTIVDFEGQLRRDLLKLASPDDPPFYLGFQDDRKGWLEARKTLIKSQIGWWRNLPPIVPTLQLVARLRSCGFEIHIATKGPRNSHNAWTEKLQWCADHLPTYIDDYHVHITFRKSLIYGRILIDDYPIYASEWLKVRPRGLVIMPVYEYNSSYEHPQVVKWTGNNIDEVLDRVELVKSTPFVEMP